MLPEQVESLAARLSGRYRFERELGRGGWGVVYLARDVASGEPVAIKVLRSELAAPRGRERFAREISIAGKLVHPNIVPLLESGDIEGTLYYVMPFVDGETLQQRLRTERQLPVDEAVRIAQQVALALAFAHAGGVVHRDIKPANILLREGIALVTDFGIARAIRGPTPGDWITSAGIQVGTPEYMSPEQAAGDAELDERSDIYSLGCVLYEMLAGTPPFSGSTPLAVKARHSMDSVPPIRTVRPTVPVSVERALERALAKVPADRCASAAEFSHALTDSTGPVAAIIAPGIGPSWMSRSVVLATIVAVAIAVWLILGGDEGNSLSSVATGDTTRYAVFPFERDSAVPAAISDGQAMRAALLRWSGVTVEDPAAVRQAVGDLRTAIVLPDDARRIAQGLRAGRYIRGAVAREGAQLRVNAILFDVRLGQLAEGTERTAGDLSNVDSAFARLADRLLFRGETSTLNADSRAGTSSLPARQQFMQGLQAVERWDLPQADTLFDAAARADPGFARAALWLALTRIWRDQGVATWRVSAAAAAARRSSLSPEDRTVADALTAHASGDFPRACALWQERAHRRPDDFIGWYGSATCLRLDQAVVPDPSSPSRWRFRTSYRQALAHYQRAFVLLPSILRALRDNDFEPARALLKTSMTDVHGGRALPPDTTSFRAFPSLSGDTLVFVPFPSALMTSADPRTMRLIPQTISEAVRRQRELFRDVATTWLTASPRDASALQALAVALELLGDPSALDTLLRARALATDSTQIRAIRGAEVWLRLRFSLPGDVAGLRRARLLADSILLGSGPQPRDPQAMAAFAALTGRAMMAARLYSGMPAQPSVGMPAAMNALSRELLVYAAMGGPADTLRAMEQRADSVIDLMVLEKDRPAMRRQIFSRAATLSFPDYQLRVTASLAPSGWYLLDALASWQRRDTVAALAAFGGLPIARMLASPADLTIDTLFPEAWLLNEAGNPSGAVDWIDPTLRLLRFSSPLALASPIRAGTLVRALALRAALADRLGDRPAASRWASAVVELWAGADPWQQQVVRRMRELTR